jgi:hypothetical protein
MFKPLGDSHYVISNVFSDSLVLCFLCAFLEKDFLVKTLMSVIMNFGHHIVNDKLVFNLIEFSLRLLILFFNIMSLSLLSLHEHVNTIRIRIIIVFLLWLLYHFDEYCAHHHHGLLRIAIVIATIICIIIKY